MVGTVERLATTVDIGLALCDSDLFLRQRELFFPSRECRYACGHFRNSSYEQANNQISVLLPTHMTPLIWRAREVLRFNPRLVHAEHTSCL